MPPSAKPALPIERRPTDPHTPSRRFVYGLAIIAALGGLLFGYDTGVISGALLFLREQFHMGPTMQGAVTSIVLAGALIGAITSGTVADRFGRRTTLICAAILFTVGALVTALALSLAWLFVGRFVVGYAIGVASYTSPLFISESSPPEVRGALVTINQLAITVGILAAYGVDLAFASSAGWRWMFGVAVIPGMLLGIGMLFLPDSPRSLVNRGHVQEAREVLTRLQGRSQEEEAIAEIQQTIKVEKPQLSELLRPALRPALIVGIGLAVFQQFVGINTVIYYAPTIFESAGFSSAAVAILATVGVGTVNMLFTIVAMFLLDRVGRRPLLIVGTIGMIIALVVLGYGFLLPVSERGWIAVGSLMLYVACFAFSFGPVFWLMISEIYPLRLRGRAMSVATFFNWASNLLVTFTFPLMIAAVHETFTFWIYAALGLLALIFSYARVPETKGRSLEEIEAHWFHS
ncbi:MAG: sugar porter family MFS transporter [Acidobacteriota bacterium]